MARDLNSLIYENLKTVVDLERALYRSFTPQERRIHRVTDVVGRPVVLIVHLIAMLAWIVGNLTSAHPIDPWPHDGMILFLACEAIVLTLLVLTTQGIMQRLDNHRAHLALQIELLSEQETTKTLEILRRIQQRLGIPAADESLSAMTEKTSPEAVSSAIEEATSKQPPDIPDK